MTPNSVCMFLAVQSSRIINLPSRTITLPYVFLELFLFDTFACPEHNFPTLSSKDTKLFKCACFLQWAEVQSSRTITLPCVLLELFPFDNFNITFLPKAQMTSNSVDMFWSAEFKNHKSTLCIFRVIPLWYFCLSGT